MAQIDDAINKLSSDELDTLNPDPKMLSDFKAKYSGPVNQPLSTILPTVAKGVRGMMPQSHLASDIGGMAEGLGQQLKTGLYDVPKALGSMPGQMASDLAKGNIQIPQ